MMTHTTIYGYGMAKHSKGCMSFKAVGGQVQCPPPPTSKGFFQTFENCKFKILIIFLNYSSY